ncbi:hypothetical protein ACFE04_031980 [Oxalis oulophora]
MEKKKYPIGAQYYTLYEEVGNGVSASVYRALCVTLNEVVAIKILDFEKNNSDLSNISREAQTMNLIDHANVLKSHCSFVNDHTLWVVMPYMSGGSCLHILKAAFPDGFEEAVIATILREVLRGLEYLHHHGHIHRDVKAGNILIDKNGAIKLGDFGVSACLFDSGDRQRMRNTFVGTPCWMAPEVMEQLHGYDFKADIWSFGITALELAHGHAPFSKYPPMKVLLMTLQNAPPSLDYERDKKFSKLFKQLIAVCLVKDPSKRPTAKSLLKHHFFKQARTSDYIVRTILEGLPALGDRIMALKRKEEDMLAQKKMPDGEKEEISQNEYKRGISGWNFNIEDVKAQASLLPDDDIISENSTQIASSNISFGSQISNSFSMHDLEKQSEHQSQASNGSLHRVAPPSLTDPTISIAKVSCDRSDDDSSIASPNNEQQVSLSSSPRHGDQNGHALGERAAFEINGKLSSDSAPIPSHRRLGSFAERNFLTLRGESDRWQNQHPNMSNVSGATPALMGDDMLSENFLKSSKPSGNNDDSDEKVKPPVVQQRGRFKVTSENVDVDKVLTQHPTVSLPSSDVLPLAAPCFSLFPLLQSMLQANVSLRESILNLMKKVSAGETPGDGGFSIVTAASIAIAEKSLLEEAHDREKDLLHEISELQWRLICAQDELQKCKTDNAQVKKTESNDEKQQKWAQSKL